MDLINNLIVWLKSVACDLEFSLTLIIFLFLFFCTDSVLFDTNFKIIIDF